MSDVIQEWKQLSEDKPDEAIRRYKYDAEFRARLLEALASQLEESGDTEAAANLREATQQKVGGT